MTQTIQKYMSLIGGLFLLAQTTLIPAASAATLFDGNMHIYRNAATSAEPIIYRDGTSSDAVIDKADSSVISMIVAKIEGAFTGTDKVIDNFEPTKEDVKSYVLGEVKKAGLNVAQVDALINCESRWDPAAFNGKNSNGSNDKGLWQINSIHKNISDADKFDYKASTKWAIAKRLADGNWSAWSCASKRVVIKAAAETAPTWE